MKILVMGPSGCGKTTIGGLLSQKLSLPFIEGDAYHSNENITKMKSGTQLTDSDRMPWLRTIAAEMQRHDGCVVACSALKKTYRDIVREADSSLILIYLQGRKEVLYDRVKVRQGHFFHPEMVEGQCRILEEPGDDEKALVVSIDNEPEKVCEEIMAKLLPFLMSTKHISHTIQQFSNS
ncbi:gluconate kinase [archaeon]|nr:gluconate kinase [archaeon]